MTHRFALRIHALLGGLLILIATLFVHDLMRTAQDERVSSVVETFSRVFTVKVEEQVHNRLDMVEMIRRNWQGGRIGGTGEFEEVATTVHLDFTDLQALNWVSPSGVIERVTPYEGNAQALGLNIRNLPEPSRALREAEELDRMRLTAPITLAQGGRGFVGYLPIRVDDALVGFINLVFRSKPLIKYAMGRGTSESFRVTINDGPDLVYGTDTPNQFPEYSSVTGLEVAGRTWTITTSPTALEVAKAETMLDESVLIFGIFLSIGTALLLNVVAQNKESIIRSEERFALAMKGATDGLFDWNIATGKTYFSPRWFQMLGYRFGEMPSTFDTFASLLHPEDAERVLTDAEALNSAKGDVSEHEFRMRHKDGSWVTVLSRGYIIRERGRVSRIVGTHVDISELRRQQSELERVAMTDDLTGLCNRRGMSRKLVQISGQLTSGYRLAILHADLDMFKSVNDMNGHDAGDNVLRVTAQRLTSYIARFDVVARIGGDEFLIAVKTSADDAGIMALATEMIEEISQPVEFDGKVSRVGASIGIAFVTPGDETSIDRTIANADIALNSSKSMGRGRCVIFEAHMRDEAVKAVAVASEIREGLNASEFTPYFQPQVDMTTRRIVGFEALARWDHPRKGVLGAAEFVPYAEKALLVDEIDDQIFKKACRVVSRLGSFGAPDAKISVNLSTAQLSDPELVERLIWTVAEENVEPGSICIEILEATLLSERTGHVVSNIEQLARAGFGLELDDFGTGHTAIASLRNFPVSRIKIDRSLISGIDSDASLKAITGAIIDLGGNLGIEVLAEGIETDAEFDYLATTRCGHAQGYFVGRPVPIDNLKSWIEDWNRKHGLNDFRSA